MKWFSLLSILLSLITSAMAMTATEAHALAGQGNWTQARDAYQLLIEKDPHQPALHYNLALCHEHLSAPGRAVLCYERALALSPRAADARRNLTLLRENLSLPEVDILAPGLPRFTAWLSREEWSLVWIAAAVMFVSGVWWFSWCSAERSRAFPLGLAIIGGILMLASAHVMRERKAEESLAVVVTADVSLRLSPFATAEEITASPPGSLVRVESAAGDFVYAELLPQGTRGWLPRSAVQQVGF
jgi:tetratricopeptide (TPR) repeat protein